ncbi:MAG: transglycosylase SLT domain-containing protein [Bryobacteraceae bacterium]|nr:transglycosylase SLT domain-containing protein [Bryobacteraceae bacterium]
MLRSSSFAGWLTMMNLRWDQNTKSRAAKGAAGLFLLAAGVFAVASPPPTLESLSRAYSKSPTAANEDALLRYASKYARQDSGGLAYLVVGAGKAESGQPASALKHLDTAKDRLPKLRDYAAFYAGRAHYRNLNYPKAIEAMEAVIRNSPVSPLRPRAILTIGTIYRETGRRAEAMALLRKYADELPQPEGLELLALNLEESGALSEAVPLWQSLYSDYAALPVSKRAESAFVRLRARMGGSYPPLMPDAMFTRVDRLIAAGAYDAARQELQDMTVKLAGANRDRARVWLGRVRYLRRHDAIALKWLNGFKSATPAVEAERLYYVLASSRRAGNIAGMLAALDNLNKAHKTSPWRLQGLVAVGNHYLLRNDTARYEPLFRQCAESFPIESESIYCHWKISWNAYMKRSPQASTLMRQHLQLFPSSANAPAALYFLGRLAERERQLETARGYYEELKSRFPNYYHATLAEDRLDDGAIARVQASAFVKEFIAGLKLPDKNRADDFEPSKLTSERLVRARLLLAAGRDDWAENELRFAVKNGAQAPLLAMELSRLAAARGDYGKSIRYIKGISPGYLSIPIEEAPEEFWQLAYPLRYREYLERYSKLRDLDPYFMAALIRQESEFDIQAVSRASARGLTQIMPSTGKSLSAKLGYRRFHLSMLHKPDVNINMGSYYFRRQVEELDGHVEAALASYNAGLSRAKEWLTWGDFQEPAEFVETIPFTETRNYVQIVLRNAHIYRRVYGGNLAQSGRKSPLADGRAQ